MLGEFESVDLRTIWNNEATDFTPWLAKAENLERLSKALVMDLETAGTEQSVGPYRADLLCTDAFSGAKVLIENQLEKTNHNHLGQILTYSAGLDVKTVVWIASRFTDEHRAALDYLNEITEEGYSFFGLEIELWKIGNSVPAPKFNIVSRPNTWTKSIRESNQQHGELTEVKRQQLAYWTAFKEFMDARKSSVRCQNGSAQHWVNMGIGKRGFWLTARVHSQKSTISADFHFKTPSSKTLFHQFYSDKDAIESEFGGALDWFELPEGKESYLSVTRKETDFRDESDWASQFTWLAEQLERLDAVFRKRVKALKSG
ncbi:DUF4268 domain-containing protein [Comamonadaceae bacterium M7527]|nr:DUF4268 domain-containing protein [Comamonadaceae bacterium M7527]